MQFSAILTSIALTGAILVSPSATAQPSIPDASRADSLVLEAAQAYKQRDRKRLTALLGQLRGHTLEPWAAYWDLSARLDEASTTEIQDFFTRYAGSYQE